MPDSDIQRLVERIEGASGPDRYLDAEIAKAIGWLVLYDGSDPADQEPYYQPVSEQSWKAVPSYTASVDAAMILVPDGCGWIAGWGQVRADEPMGGARISRNARFIGHRANYDTIAEAEAATPALALVAAALRARITERTDDE